MAYLDLDEIPDLFRDRWFWSVKRPNLAWFRRADHCGPADQPLSDSVRDLVRDRLGAPPRGPIRLLTQLRYLGVQMNPLSLFYCHGADGDLAAVVAEVHNTPWGERHCYVLPSAGATRLVRADAEKQLHVSPFQGMDTSYEFHLSRPAATLVAHVKCRRRGAEAGHAFDATLTLRRRPLDGLQLARVLCRYPVMTAQIYAGIYWQALQLWRKGARFYAHPGHSGAARQAAKDPEGAA